MGSPGFCVIHGAGHCDCDEPNYEKIAQNEARARARARKEAAKREQAERDHRAMEALVDFTAPNPDREPQIALEYVDGKWSLVVWDNTEGMGNPTIFQTDGHDTPADAILAGEVSEPKGGHDE